MADGSTTPNPMVDQSPQGDESMMMEDHVSETSHHDEEEEEEEEVEEDDSNNDDHDFFDHEPSKVEKMEMRKASKRPSEWLKLLCKEWALHNMQVVEATDKLFSDYKPYLKGYLSSQLLCRLSIPPLITKHGANGDTSPPLPMVDFWGILQITDEFDKAYIVAQIERFSALYQIHATTILQDDAPSPDHHHQQHHQLLHQQHHQQHQQHQQHHHHHNNNATIDLPYDDHAAAVAAAAAAQANGSLQLPSYMTEAAAVAVAVSNDVQKLTKKQASEVTKAHRMAKDAEKALELERRQNMKREQKRISLERKEQKAREREAAQMKKAQERMARENSREARRKRKLDLRLEREKFAQEQKEAALKRAAELVSSNRVPIEITRGAAAAKAAANAAMMQQSGSINHHHHHHQVPEMEHHQHHHHVAPTSASAASPTSQPRKRRRSAIVVSTAADLHQIVTHSKNLWAKYNAIAKEHNQKVNWITVAKELGIHVKVREKYARMHSRAEQRGFDWEVNGQMKIKDHPEIFLEPTQAEQKAKMPPPPPDAATTVLINEDTQKEVIRTDEAAVAAAAAVVDATVDAGATAAAVAASLAADPAHLTDNKAVRI